MSNRDSSSKRCASCENELPAELRFFNKDSTQIDGWAFFCKACRAWKRNPDGYAFALAKMWCPDGYKTCTTCLAHKPAMNDYFGKHKAGLYGLQSSCKICQKQWRSDNRACISGKDRVYRENNKQEIAAQQKEYRENNREKIAEGKRRWAKENKEAIRERNRLYRHGNKEAIAERKRKYREENQELLREKYYEYYRRNKRTFAKSARKYREENKQAIAEQQRRYYQENKEERRAYYEKWRKNNLDIRRFHNRKRAAAKQGCASFESVDELWQMYHDQDGLCAYCETTLFGEFHIDHIVPLSRGGLDEVDNYAITCPTCNLQKHAKTPLQFVKELGYSVVED